MQSPATTRKRARGFTLVELLTSVAVFAIGATGVVALQKATIAGNAYGREITTANQIGQSWLGMLSMDAQQWDINAASAEPPPNTYWLNLAAQQNNQWFVPEFRPEVQIGAAFDTLGQTMPGGVSQGAHFCAQIRTTWLCQPLSGACGGAQNIGNALMRAEVRVFWVRRQPDNPPPKDFCVHGVDPQPEDYHIIGLSTAIKQAAPR